MHPSAPNLTLYHLGELSPGEQTEVAAHLSVCEECRLELHRVTMSSRAMGPPEAGGLEALLGKIRRWEAGPQPTERTGAVLKQRVAEEIEPYIGKLAAHSVLQPVVEDGRNLLSSVSPLLTMFLGRRATEHLVTHVVEHAIVRI